MTVALILGLVAYCAFELVKFLVLPKQRYQGPAPVAQQPVIEIPVEHTEFSSDEHTFTAALAKFASVHTPPQQVTQETSTNASQKTKV